MSVVFFMRAGTHQMEWGKLLAAGMRRHGLKPQFTSPIATEPCELAVMWAHRNTAQRACQRANGKRYLVMERGYFRDRWEYCSLGYDGLNGRADFLNAGAAGDRWEKHGIDVAPWRDEGEYVLLMGQVEGDASLANVNISSWYVETTEAIRAVTKLPILFRPHPLGAPPDGLGLRLTKRTLEEDLARAAWVVTYNSNSGVDAALAGVPVIACDRGSMCWDVAGHRPGEVVRPDRTEWLHRLAYCQWTRDELESGEAWEHLKSGIQ